MKNNIKSLELTCVRIICSLCKNKKWCLAMSYKKNLENYSKIETFLIVAYLLGVYFFPERIKIITIGFVLSFFLAEIVRQRRIIIWASVSTWLCYIVFSILSCVWGKGRFDDAIEFIISISIALLLAVFDFSIEERALQFKGLAIVGGVVILGCVLQYVSPETLKKINATHLTAEKYRLFDDFFRAGRLVGFSFQTAITGFYLAILFGIIFSTFLCSFRKNKVVKNIVYVVSLITIYVFVFLTAKRSFILLIPCGVFCLICFLFRKHIGKIIVFSFVAISIMLFLLYKTDFGQAILLRSSGDNWSTGREQINEQMIELFWNAPIIGNGISSTLVLLSGYQNAHNIYLQVLSESGILGFCIIVIAFGVSLMENIKVLSIAVKAKQDKVISLASICLFIQIVFLGWGLTGNPLYDVYPFFVYMVSVGCINSIKRCQRVKKAINHESWNCYILSQKL